MRGVKLAKHLNDNVYVKHRKKELLKNEVLLEASKGKGIDGHIFALLKSEAIKQFTKVYVAVEKKALSQADELLKKNGIYNINLIPYNSINYFSKLARCEFLINDTTFSPVFSKRPDQKYHIIWHGTPLKHIGKDASLTGIGNVQNNFLSADAIFVSNEYTKDIIFNAFNLEGISNTNIIVGPSPRNSMLFNDVPECYRDELKTTKNYLYLPTWRDGEEESYLSMLGELDSRLSYNETLFIKLHPLAKKDNKIDMSSYKHIKEMPMVDLYQFISLIDVLITDYSSVFFDVFKINKPIILFNYDKQEYFESRGVYDEVSSLLLTECQTIEELYNLLANTEFVDYSELAKKYAKYDHIDGHTEVLEYIQSGNMTDNIEIHNHRNDRENVVFFVGGLWDNGISKAFFNFVNEFKTNKSNIILLIENKRVSEEHALKLDRLPDNVTYIERHGGAIGTIKEKFFSKYYTSGKTKRIFDKIAIKFLEDVYGREFERVFSGLGLSQFVHYTGFDASIALLLIGGCKKKEQLHTIFCHTDMLQEYKQKNNFNKKIILQAYRKADYIAAVNADIGGNLKENISEIANKVIIATNFLGDATIKEMSRIKIFQDIRDKNLTRNTPLGIKFNKTSESYTPSFIQSVELFKDMEYHFPYFKNALPIVVNENNKRLPSGIRLKYLSDVLPFIQGYTKMSVFDDLKNPDITVFSYVGRYSPEKGMERILYGFEKLYECNKNIRLILISPHGQIKDAILSKISGLISEKAIYIFEGMKNPYNLVKLSDALLLSSYYEGLGLVAIESISVGTKVITTDLPELTRVVNTYGTLVEPKKNKHYDFNHNDYTEFRMNMLNEIGNFVDEETNCYPIKFDGTALVVENSGRGIFYGMSYFLDNLESDIEVEEFNFLALREISQEQYNIFLK